MVIADFLAPLSLNQEKIRVALYVQKAALQFLDGIVLKCYGFHVDLCVLKSVSSIHTFLFLLRFYIVQLLL